MVSPFGSLTATEAAQELLELGERFKAQAARVLELLEAEGKEAPYGEQCSMRVAAQRAVTVAERALEKAGKDGGQ